MSTAPAGAAEKERLIAVPYRAMPISEGRVLVVTSTGFALLTPAEARVLDLFPRLQLDAGNPEMAAVPASLRHSGLLAGESDILRHLRSTISESAPPEIASAGVLTSNRPAHLGACVASLIENAGACGRRIEIVVIDDSASTEIRRDNIARLQALSESAMIRYCGPRQREAYCEALAKRGIRRGVCELAVGHAAGGEGFGAARNTLMLDQVGNAFLSADDDTLARTAVHPSLKAGLRLAGHCQLFDVFFFRDRQAALDWPRWERLDIIGEHSRLLGRGWRAAPELIDLDMMCCHFADNAWTPRVVGTMAGKVGDSGRSDPLWDQWIGNWTPGRPSLGRFEIAELPASAAIAHSIGCMTTMFALDLRTLLPPFPPRHPGEDGVYAGLMDRVIPNACWGIVPHGIVHDRPARQEERPASLLEFNPMVSALLSGIPACSSGTGEAEAMRAAGEALLRLTHSGTSDFRKIVLEYLGHSVARQMEHLRSLCGNGAPAEQREAIAGVREWLMAEFAGLCGPAAEPHAGFGWEAFRLEVADFGHVLHAWPEIFEAARDLRVSGMRPSVPLVDSR